MKFRIRVKRITESEDKAWWEDYDYPDATDAQAEAEAIMKIWNGGLRFSEIGRELLKVEVIDE